MVYCQTIIFAFHRKSDVTEKSSNTQSTRENSKWVIVDKNQ